jgi:Tfp pilus assembly protein PilV
MRSLLKTERRCWSDNSRGTGGVGCQDGFSLLEALLAIGILALVTVQIVSVQSASMEITGSSAMNQQATWALRSANAQLQYVLDVYGVEGLRPSAEYTFGPDKAMTVSVQTEETPIEASRLFATAVRMAQQLSGGAIDEESSKELGTQYEQIGQTLDSQIPKDIYRTIKVSVAWKQGDVTRTMEGGFLVVDEKGLTIGGGLESLMGAGGGGGDDGGGDDGGGSGAGGGAGGRPPGADGGGRNEF